MSSNKEKKIIHRACMMWGLMVLFSAIAASCSKPTSPKPHAYTRIDLPAHSYQLLDSPDYPYSFMYSKYAQIRQVSGSDEININYPKYNCTLFLTYKPITNNFKDISNDAYELVYSHSSKADAITESNYSNPDARVWSVLYTLDGDVASTAQFIATDSTFHWLRGAAYINSIPNRDSLAPVIEYLKVDMQKLIETLRWSK